MHAVRTYCSAVVLSAAVGAAMFLSGLQAQEPVNKPAAESATGEVHVTATALADFLLALSEPQAGKHWIGVHVTSVDPTLRAQLGLPANEGIVVTNVDANSPAWETGLAQHDVLLRLGDKPLASAEDLNKQVDAIGEKPVGLTVLRQGRKLSLQITPKLSKRLATVNANEVLSGATQTRYRIGVELSSPDTALRSQLKLAEDQGVVVINVVPETPAVAAGIQQHDVLLTLADKPIPSPEAMRDRLQEIGEKQVPVKLLRGGKSITVEVKPQKHEEPTFVTRWIGLHDATQPRLWRYEVVRPAFVAEQAMLGGLAVKLQEAPHDPTARVSELIVEVKDLQKKLELLNEDLKKQKETNKPADKKK